MKQHLFIIISIVIGFTTFMLGYSYSPFIEVGFGGGESAVDSGGGVDAELMKQYEQLYKSDE